MKAKLYLHTVKLHPKAQNLHEPKANRKEDNNFDKKNKQEPTISQKAVPGKESHDLKVPREHSFCFFFEFLTACNRIRLLYIFFHRH